MAYDKFVLEKQDDQIVFVTEHETLMVECVRWLRPISGIGKECSICLNNGETVLINDLETIDTFSKEILLDALEKQYLVNRIKKINSTKVHLGNRYFDVETDRGDCSFVVKNPFVNIVTVNTIAVWIRDTLGNLYTIQDIVNIDKRSFVALENVR